MEYVNFLYRFFNRVFFVLLGSLLLTQYLLHIPDFQKEMNYAMYLEEKGVAQYIPYTQPLSDLKVKFTTTDLHHTLPLLQNGHLIYSMKPGDEVYLQIRKDDVLEVDGRALQEEGLIHVNNHSIPVEHSFILLTPQFLEKVLEEQE